MENWFEIIQINDHLLVIRERLDLIDPRFKTRYTNMYLILGGHSCILFDTGSGYSQLKPIISMLIGDKDLIVINSHNHFDHVGGNWEFIPVYVHRFDLKRLTKPLDLSFLRTSPTPYSKRFADQNYEIQPSDEYKLFVGDEHLDLGGIQVKVIHTPGHTQGSICLLTTHDELLTGDTAHYGAVFLPSDDVYNNYRHTLRNLIELIDTYDIKLIYPAHEDYEIDSLTVIELEEIFLNLDNFTLKTQFDAYLNAHYFHSSNFTIIFPKNYNY